MMIRIKAIKVLDKFKVTLDLTNGKQKIVDLEPFLHGPIFEPIKSNRAYFKTVHVDEELGTIIWDNGADIDPDVLIEGLTPAWMEKQHLYSQNVAQVAVVREKKVSYSARKKRN